MSASASVCSTERPAQGGRMRSLRANIVYIAPLFAALTALSACSQGPELDMAPLAEGHDRALGSVVKSGVALSTRAAGLGAPATLEDRARATIAERPMALWSEYAPPIRTIGENVQVNDPALDKIYKFRTNPPTRPFVLVTQSETSIAAHDHNIVVAYNTSAGVTPVLVDNTIVPKTFFGSGFSTSNDGGVTWKSGFIPPLPGSTTTLGDPVVREDRRGVFHFAGLTADAEGRLGVQANRSTDGGRTWSEAVLVAQDDGADKSWLAVGPDPVRRRRDNLYVTWTSYQPPEAPVRTELRFARSTDGGETWTSKVVFAPEANPDPTLPQNAIQFTNPVVDRHDGTLYLPFLQYSGSDADFIRMLVSRDAGETFEFVEFNLAGAPDPTLLPVVQPGELIDCGNVGGPRLAITDGPRRRGRFGLPTYVHASRLIVQPTLAVRRGIVYLAWSASTSEIFGEAGSGSNVFLIRSDDRGRTWTSPIPVTSGAGENIHHVLPAVTIGKRRSDVHIVYYTQNRDRSVDVEMASSFEYGESFGEGDRQQVTDTSFRLSPTNIPLDVPVGANYPTTNFDRVVAPCYNLGEYLDVTSERQRLYSAWGDLRNLITEPRSPADPIAGQTHSQADVFFQAFKAR
ncbi:sialidase family protein [Sorangium atrum]|uniref:Sialidase family protein n=1 Tax=Sorangium atrum TaxID=2995308 RepID=A0ABT5BS67_9BACT|nr:sialidase family protein [Sorangium aterium]MDC0677011.1 sialidase family protein [Sorangium aterium]